MSGVSNVGGSPPPPAARQVPQGSAGSGTPPTRSEGIGRGGFHKPEGVPGQRLAKGLEAAGYDQATIDQVVADVTTAVQEAKDQQSSSGEGGSPHEAVRDAVRSALEKNGINPQEIRGGLRASREASGQTPGEIGGPRGRGPRHTQPADSSTSTASISPAQLATDDLIDAIVGLDEQA